MKIIAFAASNSRTSINKKLATYAASLVQGGSIEVLDLNDYELPIFGEDKEKELGQPELAQQFMAKLGACDAIIISFAEHNSSYTAAYKNLFDWCSRINSKVFQGKPVILLATSPGARGATTVLELATSSMPRFSGIIKGTFSLPSFYDNFDVDNNLISDHALDTTLRQVVAQLTD